MIYLKHLSVQHRGSWWHWIHSFQVPGKPGAFSLLIKSTARYCRLLPIWCGKVLPCCMRNMITDLWGPLDTENITLSSLTAGTVVVCHISCLYPETYLLQATADKDFKQRFFKKRFYSSKNTVAPSSWLQSCLKHLTCWSSEVFIVTTVFQKFFPSAQRLLLVKAAEASASSSNYISFSPSSATGHKVFLHVLHLQMM